MKTYRTLSSEKTRDLGGEFAKKLISKGKRNSAFVVGLRGELGSGKTTFTQGFLRELGVVRAPSPTFVLVKKYQIEAGGFSSVFHLDLYRLDKAEDILALDWEEIIKNPSNIVIVEWIERVGKLLPRNSILVNFSHGNGGQERVIEWNGE